MYPRKLLENDIHTTAFLTIATKCNRSYHRLQSTFEKRPSGVDELDHNAFITCVLFGVDHSYNAFTTANSKWPLVLKQPSHRNARNCEPEGRLKPFVRQTGC